MDLPKQYDPKRVEDKWYSYWEDNKYFKADVNEDKKPFCIVMPPPNVTGQLHMGHALDCTLQDIIIRFKRMQGYNTLLLPGTDHAGIATQAKVEEQLKKEGTTKYQIGREKFLQRVWKWKEEYGSKITKQFRKLGVSCDWNRERFTMDEGCSKAVKEVFIRLYEEGLIYRDNYIINWCPRCSTTISDIEVEHEEQSGKLYYFKYLLKDELQKHLTIATTRPETMLGDVAVAVNPNDDRYREFIGQTLILPLVGREIPIIADEYVDPEFGTGCVKITPAHDPNDFEMAQRHNLSSVKVMDENARMTASAGKYEGMDRYQCREQVVEDLQQLGLVERVEEYTHSVGSCYRCSTVIEPMISKQWFVKMKPLAESAVKSVEKREIRFIPDRFAKIYLNWMKDVRDWCISRQLWWGHRIPVYYCTQCDYMIAAMEMPDKCAKCGASMVQDPDVLDTWFSSALWPFSTLGWPENTAEMKCFYPNDVLVTGRDIIFFWVARMIFSALHHTKKPPFREVLVHGLVLDAQGRKMSKSLGNGVDPLEVIEKYGADSLRFMLVTGNTPGNDLRFHFERLEGLRNFANKIWNAFRFVLMNLDNKDENNKNFDIDEHMTLADKWILSSYNATVEQVTKYLNRYEFGEAARTLYDFIWSELCDWYIELAKPRLYGKTTSQDKACAEHVILEVFKGTMKLLHPFMPFITEEIWQHLPKDDENKSIMLSKWTEVNRELIDINAKRDMELIMEIITCIRHLRAEMNVPPGKTALGILVTEDADKNRILNEYAEYIKLLSNTEIEVIDQMVEKPAQSAVSAAVNVEVILPLKGLIDIEKEKQRILKELKEVEKDLDRTLKKLANESFLKKAPADVIEKERKKQQEFLTKYNALKDNMKLLGEKDI